MDVRQMKSSLPDTSMCKDSAAAGRGRCQCQFCICTCLLSVGGADWPPTPRCSFHTPPDGQLVGMCCESIIAISDLCLPTSTVISIQYENRTERHQPRQDGFHNDDEAERADTAGVHIRIRPHGTPSAAHRGLCRQGAHMRDV